MKTEDIERTRLGWYQSMRLDSWLALMSAHRVTNEDRGVPVEAWEVRCLTLACDIVFG